MTNHLTVAPKLTLPLEAVTSTFGLLAIRDEAVPKSCAFVMARSWSQ